MISLFRLRVSSLAITNAIGAAEVKKAVSILAVEEAELVTLNTPADMYISGWVALSSILE
jgi:hypothetical protein